MTWLYVLAGIGARTEVMTIKRGRKIPMKHGFILKCTAKKSEETI